MKWPEVEESTKEISRLRFATLEMTNILSNSVLTDKMRRALKIVLGILLILIGVFALLTPLTPGSWLALIGLEILGLRILLERKLISLLPHKYRRRVRNLFRRKVKKL